jgi:hypothetical protein
MGLSKGVKAECGSDWGIWKVLADCRLKAQFLLGVTVGLNNQRLDTVYCFEVEESFQGIFGS